VDYPKSDPTSRLHDGKFADADPASGILGSIDKARDMRAVYEEILAVQVRGGQAPSETDLTQLRKAIEKMILDGVSSGINTIRNGVVVSLDTLAEIAASLNFNTNFAGTMTAALAGKSNTGHSHHSANLAARWHLDNDTGLLTQWGMTAVVPSGSAGLNVTFPLRFPAAPNASVASNVVEVLPLVAPSYFRLTQQSGGGAQFMWIAQGY
jgi:hypothetical protein